MNDQPSRSQAALRRLLIILAVAAAVVIYAYGWEVTDISLTPTQDQVRQDSVTRALRELFSPNIFVQPREITTTTANFSFDCSAGEADSTPTSEGIYFTISPACGSAREQLTLRGFNFDANVDVEFTLILETGQPRPLGTVLTNAAGEFETQVTLPNIRGVQPGAVANIEANALLPVGSPRLSSTTNLVIEKMIETIFLALMATTLALPISVVLSFLAAHNLMKPIKMPVGKALTGVALLPIGWIAGTIILGTLGEFGVRLGSGSLLGLAAPAIIIFGVVTTTRGAGQKVKSTGEPSQLTSMLFNAGVITLGVFLFGLAGGIGIWLGTEMLSSSIPLLSYLGNFLYTIGELIRLTIVPIGGLAGAFLLMNIGMRFASQALRSLNPVYDHAIGAVLGGIGGAFVMVATSAIGTQFALLTLITPFIAGLFGGQVLVMFYERIFDKRNPLKRSRTDNVLRKILQLVGFALVAFLVYEAFNLSRSVVEGRLPVAETLLLNSALVGAVLGAILAGMTGVQASMPLGTVIYNITRTTLNALRSIEPLIMGIVFVIWVGIGPFAGVLALTLHSIASLGKLYSEQIENIDAGPIEALQATGANQIQTIIYAVVPQIVPPYIAFTLYRWDINVRMSTIIGFVGGGGIGFLLQQQINLLRYRDAGVAVLAIAIVVSILDYASASIRERVT